MTSNGGSELPTFECPVCVGRGWYPDHEPECYRTGECVGCDGVQVQCENCYGTGEVTEPLDPREPVDVRF